MTAVRLGINVDHIATVRQLRLGTLPDPVQAALIAEDNGADQITCHLREDRRHIQDDDLWRLRRRVTGLLNIETSLSEEVLAVVYPVKPDSICIVPERRAELTTEGGLDVVSYRARLATVVPFFQKAAIRVSVFIEPRIEHVDVCADVGVDAVEFHTGSYAASWPQHNEFLERLISAAQHAVARGVAVHAGHGLDYENVQPMMRLPGLVELNIGYAVVVRALTVGWGVAVAQIKSVINGISL